MFVYFGTSTTSADKYKRPVRRPWSCPIYDQNTRPFLLLYYSFLIMSYYFLLLHDKKNQADLHKSIHVFLTYRNKCLLIANNNALSYNIIPTHFLSMRIIFNNTHSFCTIKEPAYIHNRVNANK